MDILSNWQRASQTEIDYVKTWLMPEDDIENIKFKVIDHPTIDDHKNIVIDWYEIEVFDTRSNALICRIIVNRQRVRYLWQE